MKDSTAYSQALRLNKICYSKSNLKKTCQKLLKTPTNRVNDKTETMSHINKAIAIARNEILNKKPTENGEKILLTVTFNKILPDLRHIFNKNWHILWIEPNLKEISRTPLLLSLKETKVSVTLLEVINFILIKILYIQKPLIKGNVTLVKLEQKAFVASK